MPPTKSTAGVGASRFGLVIMTRRRGPAAPAALYIVSWWGGGSWGEAISPTFCSPGVTAREEGGGAAGAGSLDRFIHRFVVGRGFMGQADQPDLLLHGRTGPEEGEGEAVAGSLPANRRRHIRHGADRFTIELQHDVLRHKPRCFSRG